MKLTSPQVALWSLMVVYWQNSSPFGEKATTENMRFSVLDALRKQA